MPADSLAEVLPIIDTNATQKERLNQFLTNRGSLYTLSPELRDPALEHLFAQNHRSLEENRKLLSSGQMQEAWSRTTQYPHIPLSEYAPELARQLPQPPEYSCVRGFVSNQVADAGRIAGFGDLQQLPKAEVQLQRQGKLDAFEVILSQNQVVAVRFWGKNDQAAAFMLDKTFREYNYSVANDKSIAPKVVSVDPAMWDLVEQQGLIPELSDGLVLDTKELVVGEELTLAFDDEEDPAALLTMSIQITKQANKKDYVEGVISSCSPKLPNVSLGARVLLMGSALVPYSTLYQPNLLRTGIHPRLTVYDPELAARQKQQLAEKGYIEDHGIRESPQLYMSNEELENKLGGNIVFLPELQNFEVQEPVNVSATTQS